MTTKQQRKTSKTQTADRSQPSHPGQEQLTFLEHIYELRTRLFWIVASLLVASSVGFYFKDLLIAFIKAPLDGEKLIYLTPGGGFSFIFTVCLYFGALLTIPVVMYQIYRFLQPVFGMTSRKLIAAIIFVSSCLAAFGAVFGYFFAIPAAIEFLTTFAGDAVAPSLTAESYLGFVVAYMLGMAVLFQLPLLLYIIDYVKPFPPGGLLGSQRFVVVGAVIAAALITPTPDIVNQAIVAGPIIIIYQLGVIAVYLRHRALRRAANRSTRSKTRATQQRAVPQDDGAIEALAADVASRQPVRQAAAPTQNPTVKHHVPASVARTPVAAPAAKSAASRPAARRSIDGFAAPARKPQRTSLSVTVPAARVATQPRRLRSVDGMSFV